MKDILKILLYCLMISAAIFLPIYFGNNEIRQRNVENEQEISYGIMNPSTYEITYIDGCVDTILVWNNGISDAIEMCSDGGVFKTGNVYLIYIPYKRYAYAPDYKETKIIYNVLRYKKLQ